jgi:hypothetical protein
MDTNTQILQRGLIEFPMELADTASTLDARTDAARSENNILQWMSYLPEDCVKTMIQMGWDITT